MPICFRRCGHWGVDVIVVASAFIAGVVRRVDENTVRRACAERQKGLKRVQIVPLHNRIAIERNRADPLGLVGHKRTKRDAIWWFWTNSLPFKFSSVMPCPVGFYRAYRFPGPRRILFRQLDARSDSTQATKFSHVKFSHDRSALFMSSGSRIGPRCVSKPVDDGCNRREAQEYRLWASVVAGRQSFGLPKHTISIRLPRYGVRRLSRRLAIRIGHMASLVRSEPTVAHRRPSGPVDIAGSSAPTQSPGPSAAPTSPVSGLCEWRPDEAPPRSGPGLWTVRAFLGERLVQFQRRDDLPKPSILFPKGLRFSQFRATHPAEPFPPKCNGSHRRSRHRGTPMPHRRLPSASTRSRAAASICTSSACRFPAMRTPLARLMQRHGFTGLGHRKPCKKGFQRVEGAIRTVVRHAPKRARDRDLRNPRKRPETPIFRTVRGCEFAGKSRRCGAREAGTEERDTSIFPTF